MKIVKLFFATLILCITQSFAHAKITKIITQNQEHYITTTIDYPVAGTYQYENISEPIVVLNLDGTGIFQSKDLSKKEITWGLECTEDGFLRFKEGFDSAAYSIWYKSKDNLINPELDKNNDWKKVEFSIHFNTNKMYIMGERVKDYVN
ncbi:hypothetical protein [Flavobacterium soyangense]|uniref:Uncharacterized protein n=1 Tax=Flavobacterium soyangense TaxID=2023265 RepID=A0A930UCC1_9FLAO|nr:hypothetical protein [Flavobacterium soyangense]MBF2709460.1 hypothetical protein [Flavobacterium soyangense]